MFKYHDIRASSYCKLPKSFCNSKSIVNKQNNDNYCFQWSILAHKYQVVNHRERVSQYENHFQELNQSDIQFPMKKKDIPIFERLNNLNINVFFNYQLMTKHFHPNMLTKTIMMNRKIYYFTTTTIV